MCSFKTLINIFFKDIVSFCRPGWSGTHFVDISIHLHFSSVSRVYMARGYPLGTGISTVS